MHLFLNIAWCLLVAIFLALAIHSQLLPPAQTSADEFPMASCLSKLHKMYGFLVFLYDGHCLWNSLARFAGPFSFLTSIHRQLKTFPTIPMLLECIHKLAWYICLLVLCLTVFAFWPSIPMMDFQVSKGRLKAHVYLKISVACNMISGSDQNFLQLCIRSKERRKVFGTTYVVQCVTCSLNELSLYETVHQL